MKGVQRLRAAWRAWASPRGSQIVEYLGLAMMVIALVGVFVSAIRSNQSLGSKVTAAVAKFIDAITQLPTN